MLKTYIYPNKLYMSIKSSEDVYRAVSSMFISQPVLSSTQTLHTYLYICKKLIAKLSIRVSLDESINLLSR